MADYTIDSFNPVYARDTVSGLELRASGTGTAEDPNRLIDLIRDVLVAAGWTSVGIPAHGVLFIPGYLGFSGQTVLLRSRNGVTDYGSVAGDGATACGSFTFPGVAGAINSLVANLNSCASGGSWIFTRQDVFPSPFLGGFPAIQMVARPSFVGTQGNDIIVLTDGTTSVFYTGVPQYGNTFGGGYRLTSQLANAVTQVTVDVVENGFGHIEFKINNAVYLLQGNKKDLAGYSNIPIYRIIANPFQFAIVDIANTNDGPGNGSYRGGNSLFVTAPFVDGFRMTLSTSAVIVGPGQFLNRTVWLDYPLSTWINGSFNTFHAGSLPSLGLNSVGIVSASFPFNQPLMYSNGRGLALNAYIEAPANPSVESTIVGQVWDGIVLTTPMVVGAQFTLDNHTFECVSSQSVAPVTSLLLAI